MFEKLRNDLFTHPSVGPGRAVQRGQAGHGGGLAEPRAGGRGGGRGSGRGRGRGDCTSSTTQTCGGGGPGVSRPGDSRAQLPLPQHLSTTKIFKGKTGKIFVPSLTSPLFRL